MERLLEGVRAGLCVALSAGLCVAAVPRVSGGEVSSGWGVDHEHRHGALVSDRSGDRAEQGGGDAASSSCSHDDKVEGLLGEQRQDLGGRVPCRSRVVIERSSGRDDASRRRESAYWISIC
jgi:hypothetical protein